MEWSPGNPEMVIYSEIKSITDFLDEHRRIKRMLMHGKEKGEEVHQRACN